ncbi:hypothetical protein GCM10010407_06330 [Rarobacter incanus]
MGVHCPSCAGDGHRNAARSILRSDTPVATYTIMALCVLAYGSQFILGSGWTSRWMFAPVVGDIEPWRFITAGFMHGGILHLAMNMIALWSVGMFLERSLGRTRFVSLYLLSILGGSVGVLLLASPTSESWYIGVLGASGGVFGLFAAVVFELKRLGQNAQSMLAIIGINLVFGFVFSGISWQGHVGGLVTGALLGFIYSRLSSPSQKLASYAATAGVAVLLIALAVIRYSTAGAVALSTVG